MLHISVRWRAAQNAEIQMPALGCAELCLQVHCNLIALIETPKMFPFPTPGLVLTSVCTSASSAWSPSDISLLMGFAVFSTPLQPQGSKSTRKDLDGILGRISSWRRWSGVEMGCPGKWWWSPHPKIPPLSSMTVLYQDSSDLSWLWSVTWSPSLWEFLGKLMQIHGRHACKAMNDLNYIKSQPDGLIYSQTPLHLD